jgi:hypothetical protein
MDIIKVDFETPEIIALWEENMKENWDDYAQATKFIQKNSQGQIIGSFAVYWDDSDGVQGNFISGWSARKNLESVEAVIQHLANQLGEIFIKTNKRQMQIVANKLGELVKKQGEFLYYIVRGK